MKGLTSATPLSDGELFLVKVYTCSGIVNLAT